MSKLRKNTSEFDCYLITCKVNYKKYVGIASNGISARWRQHVHDAKKGATTALHKAIRKYGRENFEVSPIGRKSTWEEICELEKTMIVKHNSLVTNGMGYNISSGGEGPFGVKRSPETKEKLSKITKRAFEQDPARIDYLRQVSKKQMADLKNREVSRQGALKQWSDEKLSAKSREALQDYWSRPDANKIRSENQRKVMSHAGARENLSKKTKEQMKNPSARELSRLGAAKQWQSQPFQKKMKKQMSGVAKKNWEDKKYREKMCDVNKKPIIANGQQFPSLNAAAEALDIRANSLCYRLKSKNYPDYYYLPRNRYVIVDGTKYESISAAAKAVGITNAVCKRRTENPDYPNYQIDTSV